MMIPRRIHSGPRWFTVVVFRLLFLCRKRSFYFCDRVLRQTIEFFFVGGCMFYVARLFLYVFGEALWRFYGFFASQFFVSFDFGLVCFGRVLTVFSHRAV